MGDPSDNLPGVPGVGEKTAMRLVSEMGSVENVLENVHSLKGSGCATTYWNMLMWRWRASALQQ